MAVKKVTVADIWRYIDTNSEVFVGDQCENEFLFQIKVTVDKPEEMWDDEIGGQSLRNAVRESIKEGYGELE